MTDFGGCWVGGKSNAHTSPTFCWRKAAQGRRYSNLNRDEWTCKDRLLY